MENRLVVFRDQGKGNEGELGVAVKRPHNRSSFEVILHFDYDC